MLRLPPGQRERTRLGLYALRALKAERGELACASADHAADPNGRKGEGRLALREMRVEMTVERVGHDTVGDAVERIAGADRRRVQDRQVRRGERRRGLPAAHGPRVPAVIEGVLDDEVEDGRTGGNAVEILRVPLRLHQRLAAAVRASAEIGPLRRLPIEALDDGLGDERRRVDGPIREIDAELK